MRRTHILSAAVCSSLLWACAGESDSENEPGASADNATEAPVPKRFAPDQLERSANQKLFEQYCVADAKVTVRPIPNYKNQEVMDAAKSLSKVDAESYALYGDIKKHHDTEVPAEVAKTITKEAHQFLGYLCGEFRDRATMIKAKLRWVTRLNYLGEGSKTFDPKGDPWQQMRAADYEPYISLSSDVFSARESKLGSLTVGKITTEAPVPPVTVCQTRYMFAEYIRKAKTFDSLDAFDAGYPAFAKANCKLPLDEDYVYDFRGDGNFKPNSPESNGMIWFAKTVTRQCAAGAKVKPYVSVNKESTLPASVCRTYFTYPFTSRWNAARAGLGSWLLTDPLGTGLESHDVFTVKPKSVKNDKDVFGDNGPFTSFLADGKAVPLIKGWETEWSKGTLGLWKLYGKDKEKMQKAMQLAVDRHTDWYASEYKDDMAYRPYSVDQAYSPFVASSYEMSVSDGFTSSNNNSGSFHKHFMFIFKVAKKNWYTPKNILDSAAPEPDFDRAWLDERSFGNSGLANSERAWDRLGTALDDEYDQILYLRNLQ